MGGDVTIGGESGFSEMVTRGLLGLSGELGEVVATGDRGISMIGEGVLRGGTEYSEVPVDLKIPLRTFHGL